MILRSTKYQRKNFVTTTVLLACKNRSGATEKLRTQTAPLPLPAITVKSLENVLHTEAAKN